MDDICPSVTPLVNCHCADIVLGIWRRSLPTVVRNHISDMDFDAASYSAIFDSADNVWVTNGATTPVVAALTKTATEVAATNRGGRGGRNGRGGRERGGRGGANANAQNQSGTNQSGGGAAASGSQGGGTNRGPRHPDLPPSSACRVHWTHGKGAWFCADRHNCPWRDYESPRPRHNRNIVAGTEIEIVD